MKFIKFLGLVSMMCAVVGTSFASTTPIVFAKGETCGSYDGNVAGETFTLRLDKGQILYIDVDSSKPIMPEVTDPRGKSLSVYHEYPSGVVAYRTTIKGKYSVQFDPDDPHYPFAEVKFCAS